MVQPADQRDSLLLEPVNGEFKWLFRRPQQPQHEPPVLPEQHSHLRQREEKHAFRELCLDPEQGSRRHLQVGYERCGLLMGV